jgi:hypothetical protein
MLFDFTRDSNETEFICVGASAAFLLTMTIPINLWSILAIVYFLCPTPLLLGQPAQDTESHVVKISVSDETQSAVSDALVTLTQGSKSIQLHTDYAGHCEFVSAFSAPYQISAEKQGYYRNVANSIDPQARNVELTLTHERRVQQNVTVTETPPLIDPEQTSNTIRMDTPEIDNIPYPTSRDIRNLLPFNPGVVQDLSGQAHVAGSNTYEIKDLLDGFNVTSPLSGTLDMRFSADAIRTTEIESTRYPVEHGQASGGIIAFRSGMGDDHYRFNVTNFFPSFQDRNGLEFDQFVPRLTFSGPIKKGKAWFYNAAESEFDNIVISELPGNADNDLLWRGSNLTKAQFNLASANVVTIGLLLNDYHSPYDGISPLTPKQTTTDRNIIAGLAYVKDQYSFPDGTVLDLGLAGVRFRDSYEPHGTAPFVINPETTTGSFFENLVGHSERVQETANVFLPPTQLAGRHAVKFGVEVDQVHYNQNATRQPVDYLGENGVLLRESIFAPQPYYSHSNVELGTYVEDRWTIHERLIVEPGMRFDWDEIVRAPLFSPRVAFAYSFSKKANTKISAGIGLYYDRTQLQYLSGAFQSPRTDIYYAAKGTTPTGSVISNFVLPSSLQEPRVINWSIALEHKLPRENYLKVNFIEKRGANGFVFLNDDPSDSLGGTYTLTNTRQNKYDGVDISLRHVFSHGYTLFGAYTRSSSRTNEVLDYSPTLSILGPQGSGPLPWDTPNRVLSWGWLPLPITKRVDFVYTLQWHTGFAFSAVNANQQLVGTPDSYRFPDYFSFSPGLEIRFHWRKYYLGLRGVLENATGHLNPFTVNSVTDSRQFLTYSNFEGRAVTARIRIISTK